jgi:hypothetical protein
VKSKINKIKKWFDLFVYNLIKKDDKIYVALIRPYKLTVLDGDGLHLLLVAGKYMT